MASFKNEELITLSSFTYILFITCLVLGAVYSVLWMLKRYRPTLFPANTDSNIKILETKSDLKLGTLSIISVYGQRHLLVITKTGTSVLPLESTQVNDFPTEKDKLEPR
jgi:hypothetical protein